MKNEVIFSKYGNGRCWLGSITKKNLTKKEMKLFAKGIAIGLRERFKNPYVHVSVWSDGVNNEQFEVDFT